jgi:hypothetical protein
MTDDRICPKCQGRMEEGYVPDQAPMGFRLARWVRGKPKPGIFGLRGFLWLDKGMPVSTYRCAQCGYLEAYATYINRGSSEGEDR